MVFPQQNMPWAPVGVVVASRSPTPFFPFFWEQPKSLRHRVFLAIRVWDMKETEKKATISLASQAANSVVVYIGYVTLAFSWFLKWRGIIVATSPFFLGLPKSVVITIGYATASSGNTYITQAFSRSPRGEENCCVAISPCLQSTEE